MSSLSNKMDHNLTNMWVNFFMAAGIPSDVGATYALTFAENRIQNDMLLDLNKEYLRDMGITRMGDVIAILRHAKTVHESTARDRVLNTASSVNKVPVAAVTGRATVTQPSSPASRMLEHYTRNSSPAHESSPKANIAQKRKSAEAVSGTETNNIKKTRLIRFGTTNTAKQTVVKEVAAPKPTVFARLGKNDAPKPAVATIKKTVSTKTITTKPDTKAVFSRLGTKPDGEDPVIPMPKDALKYEGILKGNVAPIKNMVTVTTSQNNVRKIAMALGGTMRADEAPVNIKEKLALPKSKSVKFSSKVEYKEIETVQKLPQIRPKVTAVFNKPERRLSMPEGAPASNSVKARLGITKKVTNLTITKNVFNRLGV